MRRPPFTLLMLLVPLRRWPAREPAASAITNGTVDGGAHPVGGLVVHAVLRRYVAVLFGCPHLADGLLDGSALRRDRRVGHGHVRHGVPGRRPGLLGDFFADPLYGQSQNDPHDIAVVVFDKPIKNITPALLPPADSLSDLSTTQTFTSVGYGAYEVTKGPGGHRSLYNDVRMTASGTLNATNPSWLRISMNPATGNGGTCYGDSGGPNFLGTADIVAAITITGDAVCRSTNVVYRLDTDSARTFLPGT